MFNGKLVLNLYHDAAIVIAMTRLTPTHSDRPFHKLINKNNSKFFFCCPILLCAMCEIAYRKVGELKDETKSCKTLQKNISKRWQKFSLFRVRFCNFCSPLLFCYYWWLADDDGDDDDDDGAGNFVYFSYAHKPERKRVGRVRRHKTSTKYKCIQKCLVLLCAAATKSL